MRTFFWVRTKLKTELPNDVAWLVTFCVTWNYMIEKCFCTWFSSLLPSFFRTKKEGGEAMMMLKEYYIDLFTHSTLSNIHGFAISTLGESKRKIKVCFEASWWISIVCFLDDVGETALKENRWIAFAEENWVPFSSDDDSETPLMFLHSTWN